ncbi:glycosyltransferase family 9 protein [Desulfatitalea tepidiphila]|uniref:glycosyltransferase family 9 protein n=1 Tax=Desulfatitalea tepidiphila TaxID=1185843 RepID=UPI0006B4101E|nr:glycosyltransferase family 9 protein [Desulfatitalea tepidiphila]
MDILIVKLGALGDIINTLPLAIQLKQHFKAQIHWITAPLSYPLLAGHPDIDQAILFDRNKSGVAIRSLLRRIRSQQFDLVLDLQRTMKSGLICTAARGKRKIGFDKGRCKEMTWLLPFERIPAGDPHAHMVDQYLDFARYLGIPAGKVQWHIQSGGHKVQGLPRRYVVLNIGATKPANRWTVQGFADLAMMIRKQCGMPCVLTGGPEDVPMASQIVEQPPDSNIINLVGKTSLLELVDLLKDAIMVVTCDTGPMHLAVALGKNVVALFGPSDHRRTGPYRGKVIRAKVDCIPCNRRSCRKPICMSGIRAEDVFPVLKKYRVLSEIDEPEVNEIDDKF